MSDEEAPRRRNKLPPLSLQSNGSTATDPTPRRKKKRAPENVDSVEGESIRRVPPRPRSNSRSRGPVSESDGTESVHREVPRRAKKPKTTSANDSRTEDTATGVDDSFNESPRPKKKRKPKQPRADSQEALVGNGHTADGDVSGDVPDKPKKKRKRKPQVGSQDGPAEVGLAAELRELEDDVVATDNTESYDDNKWSTPAIRSEPVNKLFIEQQGRFKSTNKAKVARRRADEHRRAMEPPAPPQTKSTIQFAISSHRVFKTMALYFQGILGGICLWQIVSVYMLSNQGYDVLLEQYYKLALPVQAMYYFLFVMSTVAVFDRNDIARPTRRFVLRSVTLQSGAIACFFYLAGLVFSLAIARTDDKIGLYKKQPELWEDIETRDSELKMWVILNLVRGLMPLLGWFVISLRPETDRLIKNLEQADENIMGGEGVTMQEDLAGQSAGV